MHCRAVDERRSNCPKRRGQCAALPRAHFVATLEWISPPKPCRNEDVLYKTTRPVVDGPGLRQASRGNPNPHRRSQSLHGPWHTSHRGRRISPSGERGRTSFTRFMQQSRFIAKSCFNIPIILRFFNFYRFEMLGRRGFSHACMSHQSINRTG
jgi:hypothetical protein